MGKRTSEAKSEPASGPSGRRRTARRALLALLCTVTVGFALRRGHAALRERVSAFPELRLDHRHLVIASDAEWVSVDLVEEALERVASKGAGLALTDPTLPHRLGKAFESSPWVAEVRIRNAGGRVHADLTYRKPVLFVPWRPGEGCYVDAEAVVLPAEEAHVASLKRCLFVEGVLPSRLPAPGDGFADRPLRAAARLAGFLEPHKHRLDLVAIIVEPGEGDSFGLQSRTRREGKRIVWTRPTGCAASESQKLERLIAYERRFGSLDAPAGPRQFDLCEPLAFGPDPRDAR